MVVFGFSNIKLHGHILRNRLRPDTKSRLIFIHIGKCGGESLWHAVTESETVRDNFRYVERVHVRQPPVLKQTRYLIVIRNPVSRAVSAFNWRYKLVVEDEVQKKRFAGEHEILARYGSLNMLSEALYVEGELDRTVAREFRMIYHLREDISFYLTDLLKEISSHQVFGIMTTEFLDASIEETLGVKTVRKTHENRSATKTANLKLSDVAEYNLRRFLEADYAAVEKLLELKPIPQERREAVLR